MTKIRLPYAREAVEVPSPDDYGIELAEIRNILESHGTRLTVLEGQYASDDSGNWKFVPVDDPLFETEQVDVGTQTLDEDPFAGNRKHENANKPKGKKKS